MKPWNVKYIAEAERDFDRLDNSQRKLVIKAINKIATNPISIFDGGYGKPLGNKGNNNLSGFMKVKLKKSGIRIVYRLEYDEDNIIRIIVISMRSDGEVYKTAAKRIEKLK